MVKCLTQLRYYKFIEEQGKAKSFTGAHLHHIVPKFYFRDLCVNGADNLCNLCYLTPGGHLTAHWLMLELFEEKTLEWAKAVFSLHRLSRRSDVNATEEELNEIDALNSRAVSIARKGKRHTRESRLKMSKAKKGKPVSQAAILAAQKANTGRIVTKETREKLRKVNSGKVKSGPKKRWFNNGIEETLASTCPIGWQKGRLETEAHWWTNGVERRIAPKPPGPEWRRGRK